MADSKTTEDLLRAALEEIIKIDRWPEGFITRLGPCCLIAQKALKELPHAN